MSKTSRIPPPPPGLDSITRTLGEKTREEAASGGTGGPNRPPTGLDVPKSGVTQRRVSARKPGDWLDSLVSRLRDAVEAIRAPRSAKMVHEFADVIEAARDPEDVEATLVRLAGQLGDACRVELMLDRDVTHQPAPKQLAVWPHEAEAMTAAEIEALGYPLCLGLWCGDHYQMTLQLYQQPGKGGRWSPRVIRRLTTLCAMAAAAERGMHAGRRARVETPVEAQAAVRDATFLNAIFPYALSQAQRHREPLTVFCAEIDGLGNLATKHGSSRVDVAVARMAEAIAGTLRGSDVVARLDDDRIVVMLPNTGSSDALTVATVVRSAMTSACQPAGGLPELSVSLGIACFPENGGDMIALFDAADDAMNNARALGRNQCSMAAAQTHAVSSVV